MTKTTDEHKPKTHSNKLEAIKKPVRPLQHVNLPEFVRQKIDNAPAISPELKKAYKVERAVKTTKDEKDKQTEDNVQKHNMRTKRRVDAKANVFEKFLTRFYNNQFLAPAIIVMGGLVNYLFVLNNLSSAMITIVTAGLAALIFAFRHDPTVKNHEENKATRLRFEKLEDKAWELSESEERYRSIAEAFDDLLVMRDQEGKILFCNPAFSNSFGKTVAQITDTNFTPIPKHSSNSSKENEDTLSFGIGSGLGLETRELAFETRDGLKWFSWLDLPVRDESNNGDNGNGTVILSVARDITSYKISQQSLGEARSKAEEANKAKSRFLAMVSHEMRTPLNGVLGMSKLLNGTKITDEQKTYIDSISTSGSSLLHLIEEMLDITMIEAGRFKLQEQNINLRQFMSDIAELMSARAYSKNVGLGLYIDPQVPQTVHTDPARLKQIVINLVGNAIKFTHTGGVSLECIVSKVDTLNNTVNIIFKVTDTGPGLNLEDQKRIFQEFERVDDENTRNVDGAGLGLTISKAIADQLGGELSLQKSDDEGSTFALDMTLNFTPEIDDTYTPAKPIKGENILLCMSNVMEAECLQKQIEVRGADVKCLSDLNDIKKALKVKGGYNFVIIDPQNFENEINKLGVEIFIEQLKQVSFTSDVKIIVLMDPAERKNLLHLIEKNADAYLIRPVREISLLNVLAGNLVKEPAIISSEIQPKPLSSIQISEQKLAGKTILLAEDNDINKLLVTACLTKAGAKVVHAPNGKIAVELFITENYDAVLMDMHMPISDGISATQKIREYEKQQGRIKPVKIIALTADDQQIIRKKAFDVGMDDFLQKPIDPTILVEIVKKYTTE